MKKNGQVDGAFGIGEKQVRVYGQNMRLKRKHTSPFEPSNI